MAATGTSKLRAMDDVPRLSEIRTGRPRMVSEDELHALVKNDPERAWPLVLAFLYDNPGSAASQDLIEDLVYEHDQQFIDRIEAAALGDQIVRDVVEQAYVGGFATAGAERFRLLQDRLRSARP